MNKPTSVYEAIVMHLAYIGRLNSDALLDHMEKGGFFESPCSGSHHLAVPGGLAEHSLNVMNLAIEINKTLGEPCDERSLMLAALLHDLGKMGEFNKPNYVENILKSGKRSDSKPYETNKDLLYIPHEVRSINIANQFIDLTEEEEHAIYYHNGKYTHIGYDLKETPMQMILHFADLWASRVTEKGEADE